MMGRWTKLALVSSTAMIAHFLHKNTSLLQLIELVLVPKFTKSMFQKMHLLIRQIRNVLRFCCYKVY
jgi:hypothetical protein